MPAAGKTTFASYARNLNPPTEYSQTGEENHSVGILWGTKIKDTGATEGNDEKYAKWIKECDKVLFFFNGMDFLREIEEFNNGGPIGAKIHCNVLNAISINKQNIDKVFFIATHNDEFLEFKEKYIKKNTEKKFYEEYGVSGDMRSAILKKMTIANKEYKFASLRYEYVGCFNKSHFFCIDARNEEQSKGVYKKVIKYKI